MSTQLQEDLAEAIVKNKRLPRNKRKNKGELLESVGYSAKVAKHKPKEILEQKGVKDALREFGLTEELITKALVNDIKDKPKRRVRELELGAEILGMKDDPKKKETLPPSVTNIAIINLIPINGGTDSKPASNA